MLAGPGPRAFPARLPPVRPLLVRLLVACLLLACLIATGSGIGAARAGATNQSTIDGPGIGTLLATHGAWEVRCEPGAHPLDMRCALVQRVTSEMDPDVGLFVIALKSADGATMLRVMAPLGVLLGSEVSDEACGVRRPRGGLGLFVRLPISPPVVARVGAGGVITAALPDRIRAVSDVKPCDTVTVRGGGEPPGPVPVASTKDGTVRLEGYRGSLDTVTLTSVTEYIGTAPFLRCLTSGCMTEEVLTGRLQAKLEAASFAFFVLHRSVDSPGIGIPISLNGFREGLMALP
ncbi:invasion associated locus B family protein [Chthonobacter rhizosphaerae]|uniref:invasion associated locus B family protein n=1 Tax=Chthonobacter rhizosphaerae TaxID=2735553 RepID=UPI0015EF5CA5|nr:invasion associated locus B family protein [Chthonobacter rhizosphaerae]